MITFKQCISTTVLATLIAVPMAQAYPSTTVIQPEVKLSDNPPTLTQTAGYVALFLVAAYAFKKWFPPVPAEETVEIKAAAPQGAKKQPGRNMVTITAKKK